MTRRIAYWLGAGSVAAMAAWAIWLSWRASPSADAEATTDRIRILIAAAAFLVLPWIGRSRGWFGPDRDDVVARLVRLAGCAALWAIGIAVLWLDRHSGPNGIGAGGFSWLRETAGLALLGGALTAPGLLRVRWHRVQDTTVWALAAIAGAAACVVVPFQALAVVYVGGILAATARRSRLAPVTLAAGTLTGLVAGAAGHWLLAARTSEGVGILLLLVVLPAITALAAVPAGLAAAARTHAGEDPGRLRSARIRQGMLAGLTSGAAAGMVLTLGPVGLGLLMVTGPAAGLAGGIAGAAFGADHLGRPRPGGNRGAGVYVASS